MSASSSSSVGASPVSPISGDLSFLETLEEDLVEQRVIATFKSFAKLTRREQFTDHLCPIEKNASKDMGKILKAQTAGRGQFAVWICSTTAQIATVWYGDEISQQWGEKAEVRANVAVCIVNSIVTYFYSSVNSSYYSEVHTKHEDLCEALKEQFHDLGRRLMGYLVRAHIGYKVKKQTSREDNIKKVQSLAKEVLENMVLIRGALRAEFLPHLKEKKGFLGILSKIWRMIPKTTTEIDIEMHLPLQAACRVVIEEATTLLQGADGGLDFKGASPLPKANGVLSFDEEEQELMGSMRAYYRLGSREVTSCLAKEQAEARRNAEHDEMYADFQRNRFGDRKHDAADRPLHKQSVSDPCPAVMAPMPIARAKTSPPKIEIETNLTPILSLAKSDTVASSPTTTTATMQIRTNTVGILRRRPRTSMLALSRKVNVLMGMKQATASLKEELALVALEIARINRCVRVDTQSLKEKYCALEKRMQQLKEQLEKQNLSSPLERLYSNSSPDRIMRSPSRVFGSSSSYSPSAKPLKK